MSVTREFQRAPSRGDWKVIESGAGDAVNCDVVSIGVRVDSGNDLPVGGIDDVDERCCHDGTVPSVTKEAPRPEDRQRGRDGADQARIKSSSVSGRHASDSAFAAGTRTDQFKDRPYGRRSPAESHASTTKALPSSTSPDRAAIPSPWSSNR